MTRRTLAPLATLACILALSCQGPVSPASPDNPSTPGTTTPDTTTPTKTDPATVLSSDASLKTLSVDGATLAAAADGNYAATLGYKAASFALSISIPKGASATIDGADGTSASYDVPGFGATKTVAIVVKAEDGSKKSYSLVVDQADLGAPASGAKVTDSYPSFQWAGYKAATGVKLAYDLYCWKSAEAAPAIPSIANSPYLVGSLDDDLAANTSYSWKVVVHTLSGDKLAESGVAGFSTVSVPAAAPANLKLYAIPGDTNNLFLSWDSVADATVYYIYLNDYTYYSTSTISNNCSVPKTASVYDSTTNTSNTVAVTKYRILARNDFGTAEAAKYEASINASEIQSSGGIIVVPVQ